MPFLKTGHGLLPGAVCAGYVALAVANLEHRALEAPVAIPAPPSAPARAPEAARKPAGALAALDYWARSRAYPERVLPDRGFADAFEYSRRYLTPPAGKRTGQWRPLGPRNLGGRTLALAFNRQNPNTIYAGSASGGLWRSHTGGVGVSAWEYVSTGHPVLGVSTIAISPTDSNVIYIGTGEVYAYQDAMGSVSVRTTRGGYGIGVLKSTDGGASWVKSLDWTQSQRRGVWAVRMDPSNEARLFAATTEGVYRSLDAGDSWTLVHGVLMAMDLEIHPTRPDTVLVACGNFGSPGHGLYRTLNGGDSWTKLVNGLPATFGGKAKLALAPSSPNTVYVSIGSGPEGESSWFLKSTNAGGLWTSMANLNYAGSQGWYSHDVGVHPTDPNGVLVAAFDIWRSAHTPTGLTQLSNWGQYDLGVVPAGGPEGSAIYSHVDHHAIVWHPTNPNIVYFANDGGVFRTTDGGSTFAGCNGGYQTGQFYSGFSSATDDTVPALGGLQDNWTAIYEGSSEWNRQMAADGGWTAVDPGNAQTLYASWQYLGIHRSINGGANWTNITPPDPERPTAFIAPFLLAPSLPTRIYGGRDRVYRSDDQGTNWTAGGDLNGMAILSMAVSPHDALLLYAGTQPDPSGHGIFKSIDGGASWIDVTGTLPDRYPTDLAFDPTDDQTVYVTYAGFGTSHLFRTQNGGDTWQDVGSGLPDAPAGAVTVDPDQPQHIYFGNDLGVFVSFDAGVAWQSFGTGLPDAVQCMDLHVQPSSRRLRLATHGNGAYERPLELAPVAAREVPVPSRVLGALTNAPNPFNPRTAIRLTVAAPAAVTVEVVDLAGRRLCTLAHAVALPAGEHTWTWDGRDGAGAPVASGTYVVRAVAGGATTTRSMTLVR